MAPANWSSSAFAVLLQRDYGLYSLGSTISLFGMWAHKLAVAWLAWKLTEDSFWVGAVVFAELFPTLILTPYAGVIADRHDRRIISLVSQIFGMLQAFLLAWLMFNGHLTEATDIWWLIGLSVFLGAVWAFNTAARLAMVPNMVEVQYMPPAVALNSAIYNLARVVGPAIGGIILAKWGIGEAFSFNCATYLAFILALIVVRQVRSEVGNAGRGGALSQSLEGLVYAREHPGIRPMLLLLTAVAIGGKATFELLPEFVDRVFGRGEQGLAELMVTAGVGALIASLLLASKKSVQGLTQLTLLALLFTAVSIFAFTATAWFPLALCGLFLLGFVGGYSGTGTQILMQHVVVGRMRGRVMGLYGLIHRGGPAVGALVMGALAKLVGIQISVAVGGIFCLIVWCWMIRQRDQIQSHLEFDDSPGIK